MHQDVQRTDWNAALAVAGLIASACLLIGGSGSPDWAAIAALVAAGVVAISGAWWLTLRAGDVLERSGVVAEIGRDGLRKGAAPI